MNQNIPPVIENLEIKHKQVRIFVITLRSAKRHSFLYCTCSTLAGAIFFSNVINLYLWYFDTVYCDFSCSRRTNAQSWSM